MPPLAFLRNSSRTAQAVAAMKGHVAIVKLLLGNDKVDVNSEDKDGRTPLSYATANGLEAVVKLLHPGHGQFS